MQHYQVSIDKINLGLVDKTVQYSVFNELQYQDILFYLKIFSFICEITHNMMLLQGKTKIIKHFHFLPFHATTALEVFSTFSNSH